MKATGEEWVAVLNILNIRRRKIDVHHLPTYNAGESRRLEWRRSNTEGIQAGADVHCGWLPGGLEGAQRCNSSAETAGSAIAPWVR